MDKNIKTLRIHKILILMPYTRWQQENIGFLKFGICDSHKTRPQKSPFNSWLLIVINMS